MASMMGGGAGNMMKMVDTFTNSGMLAKAQTAMKFWGYVTNFVTDIVLYIFGNFLMDSILMMIHKAGKAASAEKDMPFAEGFDVADL